jgi:hypothetical protein
LLELRITLPILAGYTPFYPSLYIPRTLVVSPLSPSPVSFSFYKVACEQPVLPAGCCRCCVGEKESERARREEGEGPQIPRSLSTAWISRTRDRTTGTLLSLSTAYVFPSPLLPSSPPRLRLPFLCRARSGFHRPLPSPHKFRGLAFRLGGRYYCPNPALAARPVPAVMPGLVLSWLVGHRTQRHGLCRWRPAATRLLWSGSYCSGLSLRPGF